MPDILIQLNVRRETGMRLQAPEGVGAVGLGGGGWGDFFVPENAGGTVEVSRVDQLLPMLQVDVCVLRFCLVSRQCHMISTIYQLSLTPLKTVLALFTHTAPHMSTHRKSEHTDPDPWLRQRIPLQHCLELFPIETVLLPPTVQPLKQQLSYFLPKRGCKKDCVNGHSGVHRDPTH